MNKQRYRRPPNCPSWVQTSPTKGPGVMIHAKKALAWGEGRSLEETALAMRQIYHALLAGDFEAVAQYPFVVTSITETDNSGG
ncbi:MAG: hypothetical protein HZB34_07730 [Nitrospirae bacterium]|nr:hypothetical protein [Nitrospirota bacterium]